MGLINSILADPFPDPALLKDDEPELRWLVDNDNAYSAIVTAIQGAQRSVSISQLALDADFAGFSVARHLAQPAPFVELLISAARDRDVNVRILLNSTILLDTLRPLRRFFEKQGDVGNKIRMRGISFFPQILHAKIVIVDSSIAFLVGSPFVNGYWDSQEHVPFDSTRPHRELSGRPLHDVSVQISGAAVADVNAFFEQLWCAGKGDSDATKRMTSTRMSSHEPGARIHTTVPGIKPFGNGSVSILRTLRNALRRASSLIYIEQQYLSSRLIFRELQQALARNANLEIIIVANQNADITAYSRWQVSALREFGLVDHPRVGIFALWSAEERNERREMNQVFVHSKVVVIDDKWAMCGSANLDGVSLHSYGADFAGILAQRVFWNVRNFDIAATVNGLDESEADESASALRRELWCEHLGMHFDPESERPAGGWLVAWRTTADRNIAALNSGAIPGGGSFILPYSTNAKPVSQLMDCGIDAGNNGIHLHFSPGWFERNLGLGWVRNMFL